MRAVNFGGAGRDLSRRGCYGLFYFQSHRHPGKSHAADISAHHAPGAAAGAIPPADIMQHLLGNIGITPLIAWIPETLAQRADLFEEFAYESSPKMAFMIFSAAVFPCGGVR